MKRTSLLLISLCVLAGLLVSADRSDRPNILFIMTDQQPLSTIGAYGNPKLKTPNVDRLAHEGMLFRGMYLSAFACSPSRASFWTGLYTHHHRVAFNESPLAEDIPTLGTLFKKAGYQTAYVGKWHLGGQMNVPSDSSYWSRRVVSDENRFQWVKAPWRGGEDEPQNGFTDKWVGGWRHYRDYLKEVGLGEWIKKLPNTGTHSIAPSGPAGQHVYSLMPEEHHISSFLAREAEKFIRVERDPDKPFSLVLSFYGPHFPVAPPRPWDTLFDPADVALPSNHHDDLVDKSWWQKNSPIYKADAWTEYQFREYIALYWGYCAFIDHQVGRVLKALDDEGLTDNTIVVYTTDHGDMLASHGSIWKQMLGYDELLRVPFILRYPKMVKAGTRSQTLIESVDVLPTLLELAGQKMPASIDGRSFAELLRGGEDRHRTAVVTEMECGFIVTDGAWKLVFTKGNPLFKSNYVPFVELYDANETPLEVHNRAAEPASAVHRSRLEKLLSEWLEETGHPYATAIRKQLAEALTREPGPEKYVTPSVASFKLVERGDGGSIVELEIDWRVGSRVAESQEFRMLVTLGPPGALALKKSIEPNVPTTHWREGETQQIGPFRLTIPRELEGDFRLWAGLVNSNGWPPSKVFNGAQATVGTLGIDAKAGSLVFTPQP